MDVSRRELSLLLPLLAQAAAAAEQSQLPSECYSFGALPVTVNPKTQAKSRQVFKGETHEGYPIDMHITTMPPGQMPHPPHHHVHEEMMMIQEGNLQVTISGKTTVVGPGSVIYVHANEEHGLKNTGSVMAQYFVLAIGHQAAS